MGRPALLPRQVIGLLRDFSLPPASRPRLPVDRRTARAAAAQSYLSPREASSGLAVSPDRQYIEGLALPFCLANDAHYEV